MVGNIDPFDGAKSGDDEVGECPDHGTHEANRRIGEESLRGLDLVVREDADQLSCRQFFGHEKVLDRSGRVSRKKRACDDVRIVGAQDRAKGDVDRLALPVKSERVARREQVRSRDDSYLGQLLKRVERPEPSKELRRRDEDAADQTKPANNQFLSLRAAVFHGKIEVFIDQIDAAVLEHEVDGNLRIFGLEGHHDRVNMLCAQAARRVKTQWAFDGTHIVPHTFQGCIDCRKRGPACLVERPALRGRSDDARRALQQPRADMAFQIPQMFRNGRLRDGEIARGGRDGAAFDGAHEGAEGNDQVHTCLAVMGSITS